VAIQDKIGPWSGVAYRHLPVTVTKKADVLDFSFAGRAADNRWNVKGHPTLYLAGDVGVALAEWSRHFVENTNPALASVPVKRTVWQLMITVPRVLDMRDGEVWTALHLANAPHCFLDLGVSQIVGEYLRRVTEAQALLVPSVAMLDKLDRWNLVVFLDKLPSDSGGFITGIGRLGSLQAPTGTAQPG
jgi:RES domain-containing protein